MLFHLLKAPTDVLINRFKPVLLKKLDLISTIVNFLFSNDPLVYSMHQPLFLNNHSLLLNVVELFGDKSQFLVEYQKLLSMTLLTSQDVLRDVNKMQNTLSHLGESCLKTCDQMMNDILESVEFSKSLHFHTPFDLKLLTHRFWPNVEFISSCSFLQLQPLVDQAEHKYHLNEPYKKLVWSLMNGSIELEMDVNGSTKSYTVLPIESLVLMAFEHRNEWDIDELKTFLSIELSLVQFGMQYWVKQGIMKNKDNKLILGATEHKDMLITEEVIKMTPQLKIAMTMMKSIIRTRIKARLSEIETAAKKSVVFKTFKHSVVDILQIMISEKMITYDEGFYKSK